MPFERCQTCQDRNHQLPMRRCRICPSIGKGLELGTCLADRVEDVQQVTSAAGQSLASVRLPQIAW
jgi:hypothetical protein